MDIAKSQSQRVLQPRAKSFTGQAEQMRLFKQAAGSLPAGQLRPGMFDPGEEAAAGEKLKGVSATAEQFQEMIVATLHHDGIIGDPRIEMLAAETNRLLSDSRLADRHGVLNLERLVDHIRPGHQCTGTVSG